MSTLKRTQAIPVGEALMRYFKQVKLISRLNERRIFEAWDKVSGAAGYTSKRYYRDGKLYVTLNSSAARTHLSMQKAALLARINSTLQEDSLYDAGYGFVNELILK